MNESATSDADASPDSPRRRETRRVVLRVVLLWTAFAASGAFAVWQIHIFLHAAEAPPHGPVLRENAAGPWPQSQPAEGADVLRVPLQAHSFRKVLADPPLPAPASLVLQWALGRGPTDDGFSDLQWVYLGEADIAEAARAYHAAAQERGYQRLSGNERDGTRTMVLRRSQSVVHVSLHRDAKNAKIVRAVLTETRPARPGDMQPRAGNGR